MAEMLQSSKGGAKKTMLMYRANLSFDLLNKYLELLLVNGLLEKKEGIFFPTRKGVVYLRRFARYSRARHVMMRSEEQVQSSLIVKQSAYAR